MNLAQDIIFKKFIDTADESTYESLLSCLTDVEFEKLKGIQTESFDPREGLFSTQELLDLIHYSWLLPILEKNNKELASLFLSVLPYSKQDRLKKTFPTFRIKALSTIAKDFLTQILWQELTHDIKDLLPKECLPKDPLFTLLDIDFEKLVTLVELLSLHDLAFELKHMVLSSKLKKLDEILSGINKRYLKVLSGKKETMSIPRLHLDRWDGDEKSLKQLLHKRGLYRLGQALHSSDPSFIWYLLHKFDTGRAVLINDACKQAVDKSMQKLLATQIHDALIFMQEDAAQTH